MNHNIKTFVMALILTSCAHQKLAPYRPVRIITPEQLQADALNHHVELKIPYFEKTPNEIRESSRKALFKAERALNKIAQLTDEQISFETTLAEIDLIYWELSKVFSKFYFIMNTHPKKSMRNAAQKSFAAYEKWNIKNQYREDLYIIAQRLGEKELLLEGEEQKLYQETLRDYQRLGLHLPKQEQVKIQKIKNDLSELTRKFTQNKREWKEKISFSPADLTGIPQDQLAKYKKDRKGNYLVSPRVFSEISTIYKGADNEDVRRHAFSARHSVAKQKNLSLLKKIIVKRKELADLLGYKNWADFKTEVKMVKNSSQVFNFLQNLSQKIEDKFKQELLVLKSLKEKDSLKPVNLNSWDISYYNKKLLKEKYDLDTDKLRHFFTYQRSLNGVFAVYEHLFSINIYPVKGFYTWDPSVTLYAVYDQSTQKPLGLFYLDMFPREGKYSYFAQFDITPGRSKQRDRRPVVSLVCNFDPATDDAPSLLSLSHVETLFHEFGHVMHNILGQSQYAQHFGATVARDFVEAPSQMFEYFLKDKAILDSFAQNWRDPLKKIPEDFLKRYQKAQQATAGIGYKGQIAFGLLDMTLHSHPNPEALKDLQNFTNSILAKNYLPYPKESAFAASFTHLIGYDAGYYGYAWSDVIAADMASVFEKAPGKFLNQRVGRRLRDEVYSQGSSRDEALSVEKFLGRPYDSKAFLQNLGI